MDIEVQKAADVTPEWLASVLGVKGIASLNNKRIGTGQVSECYLFTIEYAENATGPSSVVLKVASQDPISRGSGIALGLYEREVRFYADIAPTLSRGIAKCYHSSYYQESGTFCVLLEHMKETEVEDDIVGATVEQAREAMATLGTIHSPVLQEGGLKKFPWLKREGPLSQALIQQLLQGYLARYKDKHTPEHIEVMERFVKSFDSWQSASTEQCAQGMIHGDYRLDNMLFSKGEAQRPLTVVDWQTLTWGSVLADAAYFLGCSLRLEDRRAHYDELVKIYHESLGTDSPISLEQCHEDIRRTAFFGVIMGIVSPMWVVQTERGDEMFMTMMKRHCQLILDLDSLSTLPAPTKLEPLVPNTDDEYLHARTKDEYWNESYYFDFVDPEQGIGGWMRLGITPNSKYSWYTAIISRPGQPLVSVMDYSVKNDKVGLKVQTPDYTAEHIVEEPLKSFRVKLAGKGVAHTDESAPLRGEGGSPTSLEFDLVYHTDGTPYQYRIATRYEVPCLVTGTVTLDGKAYKLDRALAQRDHSHGSRNWWAMDWLWSSIHFQDGNRIHVVDLQIPGQPQLGVGYLQNAADGVLELGGIDSKWKFDEKGLATWTQIDFKPEDREKMSMQVEPIGHGPLKLVSDHGDVSQFERAWCKCTLGDGRIGYGWVEWNRVQR